MNSQLYPTYPSKSTHPNFTNSHLIIMSYPTNNIGSGWDNNNQQQGQTWNNDPNNFSNTGGRGTGECSGMLHS